MSQVDAPTEIKKKKKPVGTQEVSVGLHETALRENDENFKKAVKDAVENQFAVTSAWEPKKAVRFVLNCPSGQKVLVKHLNTMDLIRAGLIEDLDFFTKKLFPQAIDAAGNMIEKEEEEEDGIWKVLRDTRSRARFLSLTNRLMMASAIKPKIIDDGIAVVKTADGDEADVFGYEVDDIDRQIELFGRPIPALKPGECYAGAIDFSDRMAFISELNKPLELIEPFREGSNAMLASMESSENDGSTAE